MSRDAYFLTSYRSIPVSEGLDPSIPIDLTYNSWDDSFNSPPERDNGGNQDTGFPPPTITPSDDSAKNDRDTTLDGVLDTNALLLPTSRIHEPWYTAGNPFVIADDSNSFLPFELFPHGPSLLSRRQHRERVNPITSSSFTVGSPPVSSSSRLPTPVHIDGIGYVLNIYLDTLYPLIVGLMIYKISSETIASWSAYHQPSE
jgi:hypothetical protein